jgi:hypothetical protein
MPPPFGDAQGRLYTYDANTNTNYNSDAECMQAIPLHLNGLLLRGSVEEFAALDQALM